MYKIYLEDRPVNEVIRKGNTIRIDGSVSEALETELKGWTIEEGKGLSDVHYITLTEYNKPVKKNYTGKRFVTKSAWAIGQESSWTDDKEVEHPYWYIYDKLTEAVSNDSYSSNQGEIKKDIQRCERDNKLSF